MGRERRRRNLPHRPATGPPTAPQPGKKRRRARRSVPMSRKRRGRRKAKNKPRGGRKTRTNTKESDGPTPKRPPNGYMMYASKVRPQVMEEHPEMRVGEVSKIIGGLWRKLGEEEKKRYTDASKRALEKFKAEHPNLPKSQKKKKKEAQTKVKEEKEQQEREEQEEEVLQEETEDKESEDEDKDKKEYAKASKRVQEEPPNPSKSKR